MLKKIISSAFAFVVLFISPQITNADINVWFEPNPLNISVGNTFTVNLFGTGGQTDYFNNWGLKLDYDHNLINFDSAVNDSDFHLILGLQKSGDTISGQSMLPIGFPADGLFATLSFSCLGPGLSSLGISSGESYGFSFDLYQYITGELVSSEHRIWSSVPDTITQSVPEPAAMLLLGLGLMGLAGVRRKM